MDPTNPPDSVLKWLEQDRYYRWCTYAFIPIQYAGLVFACWLWSSGDLSTFDSIGLALTMGVVGGIAINTAHELGHKRAEPGAVAEQGRARPERLRALLHRAQPRPPRPRRDARGSGQLAARRELLGLPAAHRRSAACARAWGLERERLERMGKSPWTLRNDILGAWAMTVVLFAALTAVFGLVVLPYLLVQAVLGFSLLEVVNYLEHYGLLRAASARTAATSAACPSTAGTATTSPPTSCSTTCSATATTTPTRPAATRRCATSTRRRSCRPGTRG